MGTADTVWLGMTNHDVYADMDYKNMDGSTTTYFHWYGDEGYNGNIERLCVMKSHHNTWIRADCKKHKSHCYACEEPGNIIKLNIKTKNHQIKFF